MSFDKTKKVILQLLSCSLFQKTICIEEETDWQAVLKECRLQSVVSLVYSSLPKDLISAQILEEWENYFNLELMQNSKVSYAHSLINELLVKSDIPYVILKGCVSASYYDSPMLRTMGDVDFLVKTDDFEKADALLVKNKFVSHGIKHEYEKAYSKANVTFELHKRINGVPSGKTGKIIDTYFEDIFEKAELNKTDFAQYYSPSVFHHGLIMLLHVARHMITGGVGLRHFCDWAVFVEKLGDKFPVLFEDKLKKVGLWKFAQILTQFCVEYLGCSKQAWTGSVDKVLLKNLLDDIFDGGNFGHKDKKRSDEAKLITSRKKGGVNDDSNLKQSILSANEIVRKHWGIAEKLPIIYPFGWMFFGVRYTIRAVLGKRKKIKFNELVKGAEKRKEIYKQLRLFEE